MSFSNAAESGLMKLLFQAVAWANIADNTATSPDTNISMALHTADPGEAGTQSTSEATYTSYARQNVARTTGGFSESAGVVSPLANVSFPAATGGTSVVSNFSAGRPGGGASAIHMKGTVTPNISVSNPIQPILSTATTLSLD